MSFWVVGLVWKNSEILKDQNELLIMMALASYAHEDGSSIFPSVPTLAKKTMMSERTVQRVLCELRDRNLIRREAKIHNGPWRYSILTDNLTIRGVTQSPLENERGDTQSPPGDTQSPLGHPTPIRSETIKKQSTNAPPAAKRVSYTKVFDEWWTAYGKRGSKMEAFRAWGKLEAEERALALSGIANYMGSEKPSNGYIVDGSRYLNGKFWEVEAPSPNGRHEPSEAEKAALRESLRDLTGRKDEAH